MACFFDWGLKFYKYIETLRRSKKILFRILPLWIHILMAFHLLFAKYLMFSVLLIALGRPIIIIWNIDIIVIHDLDQSHYETQIIWLLIKFQFVYFFYETEKAPCPCRLTQLLRRQFQFSFINILKALCFRESAGIVEND